MSYQLYTNELMHENIDWYRNSGFREIARREEHGFKRVYFEKNDSPTIEVSNESKQY